ncbi:MAG: S8 family peptidase [Pseudolabrys sp.]
MRRLLAIAFVGFALTVVCATPGWSQAPPPPPPVVTTTEPVPPVRHLITPLGLYAAGGLVCAAVSPMIGTAILGREMTGAEVGRSTLNCFLGPVGWVIGPMLFPDVPVVTTTPPPRQPPGRSPQPSRGGGGGGGINIPPPGETRFVADEVLIEIDNAITPRRLATITQRLQLTQIESQSFTLTSRTLARFRIGGNRTVRQTMQGLARYRGITAAQPNWLYVFGQAQASPPDTGAQYVVGKLHLVEAHRITSGDDVTVALIDSRVDGTHPDLAGVIAGEYDAVGGKSAPHAHGTGMAGAIAAHSKLIGVAPKVRLLAIRAFSGEGDSARGTTFSVLKALDWAASQNARIVNMSFAGPADTMLHDMIAKAHGRGIVLIAAVGNAGPKSPPLYPAADREVIGVTATDADDKLLPQANRGPQVAVAAPGVDVLAAAPDGQYEMTSGTSVATAHVTGVAALLLARDPKLTPDALRRILVGSAHKVPGGAREVGAGVVDALKAVEQTGR